ncbi:MAG TPA: 5-formyltetrahydrofolate cyclo-ligase [Noviherbaspirillum sp.]|uniref:5-formyltetrahydrofolate cyclo-ligase n=1 Tax=Noviherbaspirillum sp. TaxID=1926288 RepID=UPI002B49CCF0|nr:5-formyltetrahydrofolate cyclo-ligase [Noviherbaspirillum sp.]HJV87258.1 5-formyltetrahydrofolate cyclo-ligase [Noviherbaspirillum sp.]
MPDNTVQKADLRRELLACRQAIDAEVRRSRDQVIAGRVIAWWKQDRPSCLGIYMPLRAEPDLRDAYAELNALGAKFALPIVTAKNAPLTFIAWAPGDTLTKDDFGVPVPVSGEVVRPEALLIPCVGFDANRYRLGYGGGFYDRTLAEDPRPLAVGIAYACQRTRFEADPYDVPMDRMITD